VAVAGAGTGTKIREEEFTFGIQQEVLWFDVTM